MRLLPSALSLGLAATAAAGSRWLAWRGGAGAAEFRRAVVCGEWEQADRLAWCGVDTAGLEDALWAGDSDGTFLRMAARGGPWRERALAFLERTRAAARGPERWRAALVLAVAAGLAPPSRAGEGAARAEPPMLAEAAAHGGDFLEQWVATELHAVLHASATVVHAPPLVSARLTLKGVGSTHVATTRPDADGRDVTTETWSDHVPLNGSVATILIRCDDEPADDAFVGHVSRELAERLGVARERLIISAQPGPPELCGDLMPSTTSGR